VAPTLLVGRTIIVADGNSKVRWAARLFGKPHHPARAARPVCGTWSPGSPQMIHEASLPPATASQGATALPPPLAGSGLPGAVARFLADLCNPGSELHHTYV